MIFFNRSSLERALTQYVAHYHEERNHQGLHNRLLKCSDDPINVGGRVERRETLGGMLSFYYREAAWRPSFQTLRDPNILKQINDAETLLKSLRKALSSNKE